MALTNDFMELFTAQARGETAGAPAKTPTKTSGHYAGQEYAVPGSLSAQRTPSRSSPSSSGSSSRGYSAAEHKVLGGPSAAELMDDMLGRETGSYDSATGAWQNLPPELMSQPMPTYPDPGELTLPEYEPVEWDEDKISRYEQDYMSMYQPKLQRAYRGALRSAQGIDNLHAKKQYVAGLLGGYGSGLENIGQGAMAYGHQRYAPEYRSDEAGNRLAHDTQRLAATNTYAAKNRITGLQYGGISSGRYYAPGGEPTPRYDLLEQAYPISELY